MTCSSIASAVCLPGDTQGGLSMPCLRTGALLESKAGTRGTSKCWGCLLEVGRSPALEGCKLRLRPGAVAAGGEGSSLWPGEGTCRAGCLKPGHKLTLLRRNLRGGGQPETGRHLKTQPQGCAKGVLVRHGWSSDREHLCSASDPGLGTCVPPSLCSPCQTGALIPGRDTNTPHSHDSPKVT